MSRVPLLLCLLSAACASAPPPDQPPDRADGMALIAGASFRMGTDSAEVERIMAVTGLTTSRALLPEVPSHPVTVGTFYLDTVAVTNAAFARFVAADPAWGPGQVDPAAHNGRYLEHWTDAGPPPELADHPVTFVTWQAAAAYCAWRGKRLPTEAEFEWAAQDGTTRAEYPWGDAPPADSLVNWHRNRINHTVPVASYPPNRRGLYDMAGNVWQFTTTPWTGTYAEMLAGVTDQEAGDSATIRRVVRGGSWGAAAVNLRVRYRDSHRPFDAREIVGFRCARPAPGA